MEILRVLGALHQELEELAKYMFLIISSHHSKKGEPGAKRRGTSKNKFIKCYTLIQTDWKRSGSIFILKRVLEKSLGLEKRHNVKRKFLMYNSNTWQKMYLCITLSLKINGIALILKEHMVSQCADDIIWELDIFRSPDSEVYPTVFSIICQIKFSAIYLLVLFPAPSQI